jgi:hypothetical protein
MLSSLILLLACGLAGTALGESSESVRGAGLVLEKDTVQMTVLLDGQIELHVTPETRILDAEGNPITLAALPTAPRKDVFLEITGEATVRYEATLRSGKLMASSIEVQGKVVQ